MSSQNWCSLWVMSLQDNSDIDLMWVEQFSTDAFRTLFKIRRASRKDNMHMSGTPTSTCDAR